MAKPWFVQTVGVSEPIATHMLHDTSMIPPEVKRRAAQTTADAILRGDFPTLKNNFKAGIRCLGFNPDQLLQERQSVPAFFPVSDRLDLDISD